MTSPMTLTFTVFQVKVKGHKKCKGPWGLISLPFLDRIPPKLASDMIIKIARYKQAYFFDFGHVTFVRGHNAFYGYRPFISGTKEDNEVKLKGKSISYILFDDKSDDLDLQGL